MADLFRLEAPELPRAPVLICAIDSWIDAGLASSRARAALLNTANASLVGRFDAETLVDHQARRPVLHLLDGVNTSLEWPTIDLHLGEDPDGRRFLLLAGAEPDRLWPTLATKVVELAREAGVRRVLTLGAYPAPVPHTRTPKIVATASTQALADLVGFVPGTLTVPAGFNSAVERICAELGVEACGLWAQVPHYVANLPYPAATVALLEAITKLTDLRFELTELRRTAIETGSRIDTLIAGNLEHLTMVGQLETQYDQQVAATFTVPTADELGAELEQFLRNQND